jgi:AAA+ ATPase superfamily predicted ATPase
VAGRGTPAQQRDSFAAALANAFPGLSAPSGEWNSLLLFLAAQAQIRPLIAIFDEFSYAAEADSTLLPALRQSWEGLSEAGICLVLCGSHSHFFQKLSTPGSPLGEILSPAVQVGPIAFNSLDEWLPGFSWAERTSLYAVSGGMPAYLAAYQENESVGTNLQRLFTHPESSCHSEPFILLDDLIQREAGTYEAVLKAAAVSVKGTSQEISQKLGMSASYLSPYLKQLEALHILVRQVPVTLHPDRRGTTKISRYRLADSFLHFYYRFISPNQALLERRQPLALWAKISDGLRSFTGEAAFKPLCRHWLKTSALAGRLPFHCRQPEEFEVGMHWSANSQADAVAIHWAEKLMLVAACEWGIRATGPDMIASLPEKARQICPGPDWVVKCACFTGAGFTPAAHRAADSAGVMLVDLENIAQDLAFPGWEGGPPG